MQELCEFFIVGVVTGRIIRLSVSFLATAIFISRDKLLIGIFTLPLFLLEIIKDISFSVF